MKRREFISLIGGAAAWPLAARGQQPGPPRRIGVLTNLADNDQEGRKRMEAFLDALQKSGWRDGDNIRIDYRHTGKVEIARRYAADLAALAPDVIFATGSLATGPLLEVTHTVPIVFVIVPDPVGAGFVERLARPGGNATGFSQFEYALSSKWIELLREIAPRVTQVGVLRDVALPSGTGQFGVIQAAAASLRVESRPIGVRDADEIERGITMFSRGSKGGLIVTGSPSSQLHRG